MRSESSGSILSVRAVEDCIRATHKYTKGLLSGHSKHPVQGADFPSSTITERYKVYPDTDFRELLSPFDAMTKAVDLFWGDLPFVVVLFHYDYRGVDKARVTIKGGNGAVQALDKGIPGFTEAMAAVGAAS